MAIMLFGFGQMRPSIKPVFMRREEHVFPLPPLSVALCDVAIDPTENLLAVRMLSTAILSVRRLNRQRDFLGKPAGSQSKLKKFGGGLVCRADARKLVPFV